MLIVQGDLYGAMDTFREALQTADELGSRQLPFVGLAATGISTVLREWNDLDAALQSAREGIELSRLWGQTEVIIHGYIELAQVLQARCDPEGALKAICRAEEAAHDLTSWAIISMDSIKARLHLYQGNLEAASLWIQESGVSSQSPLDFVHMADHITLARVFLAQGVSHGEDGPMHVARRDRLHEALGLLARLLDMSSRAGATGYEIEILVLQAVIYQALGDLDDGVERVTRALALAKPAGYVRTFVEAGPSMMDLLKEAAVRGTAGDYVARLLAAFRAERDRNTRASPSGVGSEALVEPLSDRELQVLRLIAVGLTNKEIAHKLVLAVGTVKKHNNNIYGKLGVSRRAQAIRRAQELGLI
jgi:LuxR family maltose regulon positive regulatory protein